MPETTSHEYIVTEIRPGGVGLVRINRPRQLNALNSRVMEELVAAVESFDADPAVGAVVITGDARAFAAGADIKEMAEATAIDMLSRNSIGRWDRLRKVTKPLIAACSGYVLGGGNELAMTCDIIVASESARFGQPEINLGVIPGAGGTQRLTHAVGKSLAMEMVLTGRQLTAEEALRYGLVSRVVPVEVYLDEACKLAAEIASKAPIAVRFAKEAVNKAYEESLTESLGFERLLFYYLFASEDQKEGMRAFIDKRQPMWTGR